MEITEMTRSAVVERFARSKGDTGSPEVQIALFSQRIKSLTEHLKEHKKDHATRRGLRMLVGQRAKLLRYLARENFERYRTLIGELGIRR
jgi:small subunit ribosomal protein S15|tara:strand:- start:522 stop:791 length:270 start_codon:yes stop_codon:yes gene_type:complete